MHMRMTLFTGLSIVGLVVGPIIASSSVGASTFPGGNGAIAFTKTEKRQSGIWTIEMGQGAQNILKKKEAKNPIWSPDGTKVAYEKEDRLYIMNADGSNSKEIAHQRGYDEMSPVWSNDGSKLAFVREKSGRHGDRKNCRDEFSAIFSVRANGQNVTNVSGWSKERAYTSPSWSPTGERIVYVSYNEKEAKLLTKEVAVNGSVLAITNLSDPIDAIVAWSPSSEKILYQDSKNEIYTIWSDGSRRSVISDGDSYDASWSPDGTQVAFVEDPKDDSISIREADGTVIQVPIEKGEYETVSSPTWSPDGTKILVTLKGESNKRHDKGQKSLGFDYSRNDSDVFAIDLTGASSSLVKVIDNVAGKVNWQARH